MARWQTDKVAELLRQKSDTVVEVVVVETEGDRRRDVPIHEIGGRGVFTKEVQAAVLDGRADFAVHSAKDLPSSFGPEGLVIGAVPERGDRRDALVGKSLADLPPGALVATGSVRRRAQLAWHRPDLTFTDLRGNIGTRLEKAKQYDAVVMAAAALVRLERTDAIAEILEPDVLVPQVSQGALAVECRDDDDEVRERLAAIEHEQSRREVDVERAFLARLGGGCDLPVGASANDGSLVGMLASFDGRVMLRERGSDGAEVAERLLANGGEGLLGPYA